MKKFYGEIEIDWTDREWERLQKVQNGEYGKPARNTTLQASIPIALYDKVRRYAKTNGKTIAQVVREMVYIFDAYTDNKLRRGDE